MHDNRATFVAISVFKAKKICKHAEQKKYCQTRKLREGEKAKKVTFILEIRTKTSIKSY